VNDEITGLDPPADRTGADVNTFGHLGDREEANLVAAVTATKGNVGGTHDAAPSSETNVANDA
jgi:hypothetical protein